MQKYAKLTDGKIEFAPQNKGAISNYNLSSKLMTADGYKPFVVVEEPTPEKPIIHYRDTKERIEQYAEAKPIEQKESEVRAVRNQYLKQYIDDRAKSPFMWNEVTEEEKAQIGDYRKYLMDYPETEGWYEQNPMTFEEWKQASELEQIVASGD